MSKTLRFEVINQFSSDVVLTLTMPYNPWKSMMGYYSRLWKRLKPIIAETENTPVNLIKLKPSTIFVKTNKITWQFYCGVVIEIPHDATAYDYEIVIAQLNVILMKFKPPTP